MRLFFIFVEVSDDADIDMLLKEQMPTINLFPRGADQATALMPIYKHLFYKKNDDNIYYNDLKINNATKRAIVFIEEELPALFE